MKETNETNKYSHMLDMPHHVSMRRPHMSMKDRAAQFAPFAALTGHDAAVKETARLTSEKIQLDENEISVIDQQLRYIRDNMEAMNEIEVTYFIADSRKAGGEYVTASGRPQKFRDMDGLLVMEDSRQIPIKNILKINLKKDV